MKFTSAKVAVTTCARSAPCAGNTFALTVSADFGELVKRANTLVFVAELYFGTSVGQENHFKIIIIDFKF